MKGENTNGFNVMILTAILFSAFIVNFVSYGKMGNKQYINQYLHMGLFVIYFVFGIGIQLLSSVPNFMKGPMDLSFHYNEMISIIPKLIFLGALLFCGIIETETGPALAKSVKDDMGQDVTQEKILYETYGDYFTFKLLSDIFLFVMFIFITAFSLTKFPRLSMFYDNAESINHWGTYVGFGVFTVLHFVFQGLRYDILKNFLTDGFQMIPENIIKFMKRN